METEINIMEIKRMEVQETLRERTINLMDAEPTDDNIDYRGVADWIRDAAGHTMEEEIGDIIDVAISYGKDVGLDTIDYIYECREGILDRIWEEIDDKLHCNKHWIKSHNYVQINNIKWNPYSWFDDVKDYLDEDGRIVNLEKSMTVEVPIMVKGKKLEGKDLYEYISKRISENKDWGHKGFEIDISTVGDLK